MQNQAILSLAEEKEAGFLSEKEEDDEEEEEIKVGDHPLHESPGSKRSFLNPLNTSQEDLKFN